jgi:organic radical activating enzyme
VIARKGKIEILQLSGGEPTLHPDLFELLAWAREQSGIDYFYFVKLPKNLKAACHGWFSAVFAADPIDVCHV